jgi:hypothetical protein
MTTLREAAQKAYDLMSDGLFESAHATLRAALAEPEPTQERTCTCHPDDNPPVPCPRKYALAECRAAAAPPQTPMTDADRQDARRYRAIRAGESTGMTADKYDARVDEIYGIAIGPARGEAP